MTKLEELYQSIDTLKKLGVKINKQQLAALDEFEEELIKDEVLPALSQDIAPRLNPIKRDLILVVEYHPGEPISVALSRKAKISDFSDAKPLTPVSRAIASNERQSGRETSAEPSRHVDNPTKGLKVTFDDGTVVWYTSAIETYIAAIKHIGFSKVAGLNILHCGYNIVSKQKRPVEPGRVWQHESDGWYIYSNISNETKISDLRAIAKRLKIRLRIEEVKPKK